MTGSRAAISTAIGTPPGCAAFGTCSWFGRTSHWPAYLKVLLAAIEWERRSPRGTAFLRVRSDRWPEVEALNANWHAAPDAFAL